MGIFNKGEGSYVVKDSRYPKVPWVTYFLGSWCLGASRDAAYRFKTKKDAREISTNELGCKKIVIESA